MLLVSWPALAQYKWVAPDGTVTYGDRPPDTNVQRVQVGGVSRTAANVGDTSLPYELRGPVAKHPVTLFTTPDCTPCNDARALLAGRGVPFSERVLRTQADVAAFKQLGFADKLMPAISVGRQHQTGFEATSLGNLLDAAGYPKQSKLARGWKPAPAEPLVAEPAQQADGSDGRPGQAPEPSVAAMQTRPEPSRPPMTLPTRPASANAPPGFRF